MYSKACCVTEDTLTMATAPVQPPPFLQCPEADTNTLTRINCEHAHAEPRGREVEGRSGRNCTRHRDHIRRTRRRRVTRRLRSGKDLSSAAGGNSLERCGQDEGKGIGCSDGVRDL